MPRPPPQIGLNLLLSEQHDDWRRGLNRRVEEYIADYPKLAGAPEALIELIYGEYCLRRERGETPSTEEYCRRFPQLAERLTPLFALHGSGDGSAFETGTHAGSAAFPSSTSFDSAGSSYGRCSSVPNTVILPP